MKILILDFETKDPYIKLGLGAGWPYKLHVPTSTFRVLGYSYCIYDTDTGEATSPNYYVIDDETTDALHSLLIETDAVCMHNAPYDLGCLLVLNVPIDRLEVLDTQILGKLYDNTLMQYSLEFLSSKYCATDAKKEKDILANYVLESGLSGINPETMTAKSRAIKWAYENMDVIQENNLQVMADYANQDIVATAALLKYYLVKMKDLDKLLYWCRFQRHLTIIRSKGIKVDMEVVNEGIDTMRPIADKLEKEITAQLSEKLGGIKVNLHSPAQLKDALLKLNYKIINTSREQLEKYKDDPFISSLLEFKETDKICRDFFEKTKEMQQYTCPEAVEEGAKYGRLFPELNLFGATATGRFSSKCPNIQQIPSRSEEWGKLCRAMFIANKGKWISADYSNQEGRLQIHYAYGAKCTKADIVAQEFINDPYLDLHQKTAELTELSRKDAKAINLGLSYGMGSAKLSRSCGYGTQWVTYKGKKVEVADENGEYIIKKYNEGAPYLKELYLKCSQSMKMKGFIKTIGGRILRRDDPRFDYKAMNKLIQGSAADQCLMAIDECMKQGLEIINVVHDEINICGDEEDMIKLKTIMENCLKLSIPVIAEVKIGNSWAECK